VGRPVSGKLARKTDTTDEALGAVITELRVKNGWGYEDVAHKVGCSPSYMNGIEHGKHNPTLKVIQAIADVHNVKLSKLFSMAERKHKRRRV
jgi:transcriptional regulator with XRE-family HTH domain